MERNNQIIVYEDFAGYPYQASFYGNQWWVTTPGEILQPLPKLFGKENIDICFACHQGGTVDVITLAKMLGRALEHPFDTIDVELNNRLKALKRLGVCGNWEKEVLWFEWKLLDNKDYPKRQGKYSIRCWFKYSHARVFDIDAFDDEKEAKSWAKFYFDFLRDVGIKVYVNRKMKKN